MANSGYAAIGHLLVGDKSEAEKCQILRTFCKLCADKLSEKCVEKDTLIYKFDLFFGNIRPTVESFSKFFNCFVKRPQYEESILQLRVEKLIWSQYLSWEMREKMDDDWLAYQVFCIFNRFCDEASMTLTESCYEFLSKKLLVSSKNVNDHSLHPMNLSTFFNVIFHDSKASEASIINDQVEKQIKRLFDNVVRDVHHAESQELKVKLKNEMEFRKKNLCVLTSKYILMSSTLLTDAEAFSQLINQDDLHCSSNSFDVQQQHDQQHFFSLLVLASDIQVVVERPQQSLFSKTKTTRLVLRLKNSNVLEMKFNADKDQFRIYQWTKSLEEALKYNRLKATKLKQYLESLSSCNDIKATSTTGASGKKPLERVQTCLPIIKD